MAMDRSARDEFERLLVDGAAHLRAGRLADAEGIYRAALAISDGHAIPELNLGVIAATRRDGRTALSHFDRAIAAQSNYALAHFNRANTLLALGNVREAIGSFSRVCAIEPEHYDAHRALGFLWLGQGARDRALDHFARTYELRRGEDQSGMAKKSMTEATKYKLQHDAEQFRFLSNRRRDGRRFELLAQVYEEVAEQVPQETMRLTEEQLEILGEGYNTAIHIRAAPEIPGHAVRARWSRDDLTLQYRQLNPGIIFFDDFLTDEALRSLQQYLLESTIWHDFNHIGGFVASYLEDGLACPLLLQIADELRRMFPEILGPHPLAQAWAFKAVKPDAAVDVHADDGAVSVNFWVTATEGNLAPRRGGLTVCRLPPPPGWELHDYAADKDRIVSFLARAPDDTLVVPYRQNRAVLFESRLFHWSDQPEFSQTYETHRINVTLLFGQPAKTT
jgi:tetratricopeptide (TPR) repeat protein